MPRNSQQIRQLFIIKKLEEPRGYTLSELIEMIAFAEGKVSRRTVERDIAAIEAAGFPILDEWDTRGQKRWKLLPTYTKRFRITYSLSELISLYMARNTLSELKGSFFYDDLQSLCLKIEATLGEEQLKYLNDIRQMFYPEKASPAMGKTDNQDLQQKLVNALLNHQTIRIRYYSRERQKEGTYEIDPYIIFPFTGGRLYLDAYSHKHKEIRTFNFERIKSLEFTPKIFERPDEEILRTLRKGCFGIIREEPFEVKIRFNKCLEPMLRSRQFHPTQKISRMSNGDILFTMKSGGRNEIIWWVLSYGSLVEVLEPREMREQILRTLKDSLKNYKAK